MVDRVAGRNRPASSSGSSSTSSTSTSTSVSGRPSRSAEGSISSSASGSTNNGHQDSVNTKAAAAAAAAGTVAALRSAGLASPASPGARPRPMGARTNTMNGPLYMQTSGNRVLVRRLRRKDEGTWRSATRWFVDNQISLSFNLLALLILTHVCIPRARPHTRKFFALGYHDPATGQYGVGPDDGCLIAFCIVLFTGLRAGAMEYLLAPLGKAWGVAKPKDLTRFSEQAWLLAYYAVFWSIGMYLYSTSSYFLTMRELWTNWPIRTLDGAVKGYMLAQLAFWLQQLIVIHIEERRKDHWQMLFHHAITITLISSCYCYHQTRVGNLILVLMDVIDLFFPLAKCLKYVGQQTLCDITFGVFMVSWFLARHVLYLTVCWSIYSDAPAIIPQGCFRGSGGSLVGPTDPPPGYGYMIEPFTDPAGYVCFTKAIKWTFLTPLLLLQVLTIVWFIMIIRVAARVVRGGSADDVRSDDEGEAADDEGVKGDHDNEATYEFAEPLEEEVGVEALDLRGWERRAGVRRCAASTSGVSLPGHSDRKELLGRIGCEKQMD